MEVISIYYEKAKIISESLLETIAHLYLLNDYDITLLPPHDGGRNIIYICEKPDTLSKVIRISYITDRTESDYLAELEFVNYLANNGAKVSRAISSRNKMLVESITVDSITFYITVFYKAKGTSLAENNYQYREGVPISEYFENCGRELGKIHQLAKLYKPTYERYSFFDKYTEHYIDQLIPCSCSLLKQKLVILLGKLKQLEQTKATFGLVHFDFNDGNYNIDFSNGDITTFDFDNCCRFWYIYDLASLWIQGVGWIQFEADVEARKSFMKQYFNCVITGYRLETNLHEDTLSKLSLFIQANIMESILDAFELMKRTNDYECDEELSYRMKCIEEDIEFYGFFDQATYNPHSPFQSESRVVLPF